MASASVGASDRVLLWAVAISFALHLAALARVSLPGQATPAAAPLPLTVHLLQRAAPSPAPPAMPQRQAKPVLPVAAAVAAPQAVLPAVVAAASVAPVEAVPAVRPAPSVATASSAANPVPVVLPRFDADYLNNPRPAYPVLARRLGEQGRVLLRVLVSGEGRAREVQVKEGSGFNRLDQAAREAVSYWRFVPARQGSESVEAWVLVPIAFSLD